MPLDLPLEWLDSNHSDYKPSINEVWRLPNGRVYKLFNTGKPYILEPLVHSAGLQPVGGIVIHTWFETESGVWGYIDNAEDWDAAYAFLKLASRHGPPLERKR